MRNLNECQAEVFCRSEKRIKARKQRRNRILMTCVPLALCVSVLSVFMLSGGKLRAPESNGASGMPAQNNSLSCAAVKVEVSGQGQTKEYTDREVVTTVYTQISNYSSIEGTLTTGSAGGAVPETEVDFTQGVTGSLTSSNGYRIDITLEDGSKYSYTLSDRVLTVRNTFRSYALTKQQYKELMEILDIES